MTYKLKISNTIKQLSRYIQSAFSSNGYNVNLYLVGGAVRDMLIERTPNDYDFVLTGVTIEEAHEILPDTFIVGKNYPVLILVHEKEHYEISVAPSLKEDRLRRDYTINSLYYDLAADELLEDIGLQDLRNSILRCVNPDYKFTDDPVRILRGLRMIATYKLEFDYETYYDMQRLRNLLFEQEIPPERIFTEMRKGFTCGNAFKFVQLLDEFELLEKYFPAVHALKGVDGGHYHNETVFNHVMSALKALDPIKLPFQLKLAALYHDVGKQKWEVLEDGRRRFSNHAAFGHDLVEGDLSRLKFPIGIKLYLKTMVYHHMQQIDGKKSIFKLARALKSAKIPIKDFFWLRYADKKGSHVRKTDFLEIKKSYKNCLKILNPKHEVSITDLKINGRQVMKTLGISQGKEVGIILRALFEKWCAGEIQNNKMLLLKEAQLIHAGLTASEICDSISM